MFREMRRFKQQVSTEECIRILKEEPRGILSMIGEDGYPYGIPLIRSARLSQKKNAALA